MAGVPLAGRRSPARTVRGVAFLVALTGVGALLLMAAAAMLWPSVEDRSDVDVTYDPDGPVAQPFRAFGLDGWLVRQADGSVRAFSAASPHRGCRVTFVAPGDRRYDYAQWNEQHLPGFFFDICYNSTWTLEGLRTFGPAPRGLDEFTVRDAGRGIVSLNLTRVRVGRCASPSDSDCSTADHPGYRGPARIDEGRTAGFE